MRSTSVLEHAKDGSTRASISRIVPTSHRLNDTREMSWVVTAAVGGTTL